MLKFESSQPRFVAGLLVGAAWMSAAPQAAAQEAPTPGAYQATLACEAEDCTAREILLVIYADSSFAYVDKAIDQPVSAEVIQFGGWVGDVRRVTFSFNAVRGRRARPDLLLWREDTALLHRGAEFGPAGLRLERQHSMADDVVAGIAGRQPFSRFRLEEQPSGTDVLLQAVSVVDENVAWVSGHGGTYVRTTDGGITWTASIVPGADTLQFRDVYAVDENTAYLLSAGPGELSRIFKTEDAGENWTLQWTNGEPDGFYDCLDFWDADNGIVYGDAVGSELRIRTTTDGGRHWDMIPPRRLPEALAGEGGFAASGTCLATAPGGRAWIGTGAADTARVLHTKDMGLTWSAVNTPLVAGSAAGITSVVFRDTLNGLVFGGDLRITDNYTDNVAVSLDGGGRWVLAGRPKMRGGIYGGAYVPEAPTPSFVIVGPGGADFSSDNGTTWSSLDRQAYWATGAASPSAVWLVGPEGRIVKVTLF